MIVKHTKGEWIYNQNNEWPFDAYIENNDILITSLSMRHYSTDDNAISDVIKRDPLNKEVIANAKLIAAAPELLEALIELSKAAYDGRGLEASREKARQAIKKATE